VALVNSDKRTRHFTDADALAAALAQAQGKVKLVATDTIGEPRRHLKARFVCDEQGQTRA